MNIFVKSLFAAALLAALPLLAPAQDEQAPAHLALSVAPATAKPGDIIELQLTLTVQAPWHAYADTPGSAGQEPMKIEMKLPEGLEAQGQWVWPPYTSVFEGFDVHLYEAGKHIFKRKLKVTASAAGPIQLKATVTYQCCNPELCAPVEVLDLTTLLQIMKID